QTDLVSDRQRTWVLSWYNVILDAGGALGALGGAMPVVIDRATGIGLESAYRWLFAGYTIANFGAAILYFFLTDAMEIRKSGRATPVSKITTDAKRIVRRISALFALDAAGGGFLADALFAYLLFQRFGLDARSLGALSSLFVFSMRRRIS